MNNYPKNFQKVVDYLKGREIYVQLATSTNYFGGGVNLINIHHRYNLEKNGLFALLHEAGHSLQTSDEFGPNHYRRVDDMDKPKEFNMYRFMNEVDAWDRGERLAEELGIRLNKKDFVKSKEEALLTYYC
jgi:hypothetical protein